MDLYKEVLINLLKEQNIKVSFEGVKFDYNKILEDKSYMAMNQIKKILADETMITQIVLEK